MTWTIKNSSKGLPSISNKQPSEPDNISGTAPIPQQGSDNIPQDSNVMSQHGKWTVKPAKPKEETLPESALRWGAMGASAVSERVIGFPGDIKEAAQHGLINLYEQVSLSSPKTQKKGKDGERPSLLETLKEVDPLFSEQPEKEKQREAPDWFKAVLKGDLGSEQSIKLPTSKDVRERIAKATGGYTEPKGSVEELYRNFVSNFTDLTMVGGRFRMTPARRAGAALGSELIGDLAQKISGKESDKAKAKAGSLFLLSVLNPGGARQHVSNMYNGVRDAIPANQMTNATHYANELDGLITRLESSGVTSSSMDAVIADARAIRDQIRNNNGNMNVRALLNGKHIVNENRGRYFAQAQTDMGRRTGRHYYGELSQIVDRNIERTLMPINQQALRDFQGANQAWSTLHEASTMGRRVSGWLPKSARGSALAAIFEVGYAHPALAGKLAGGAAAGLGIVTGVRVMTQVMNSPTLRRYYLDAAQCALQGDRQGFLQSWNELNRAWEVEEKNDKAKAKR